MPSLFPVVNKARKPKFELHLTIYDLNNVPLVNGVSQIKWHLPHSMHGEHRGRTEKLPIDSTNHRVTYNYSKVVPMRISIDRNNNLTECPIEFEVAQEFPVGSGGRDEKITLGVVKLNLSEYVEESESYPRRSTGSRTGGSLDHAREKILGPALQGHRRMGSTNNHGTASPGSSGLSDHRIAEEDTAEEGIVRRYLMQESKINSTLKLGILMVQIDGDRNYVAPPLKTAPMFGGIAGIMAGETVEPVDESAGAGTTPNLTSQNKSRDASELQDMYRRALAASWSCQPGEMPADECIEDIFAGGDGWKDSNPKTATMERRRESRRGRRTEDTTSPSGSDEGRGGDTLRPSDARKVRSLLNHARQLSGSSDKSLVTVKGRPGSSDHSTHPSNSQRRSHNRQPSRDNPFAEGGRSRSGSLASLVPTLGSLGSGSASGHDGLYSARRHHKEVHESEVRDDLISWSLPGTAVS
ncbi:hypothetical protein JX265_012527 [Neoarthrinium moseri]|uniref:C2 NT-type domain-containing protein n=1 Tax=Neoarthrinium moseri TaxID=1658444 RepID=A0A9P9WAC1_9PEZI|nr:hypothetical protein JX266_012185 [Neoarthrinium moseri]KAI1854358.1 hypothetical protein JX265_012527 [Neoarthrinium moseri]